MFSSLVSSPGLPSLIEAFVSWCWDFRLKTRGDHTAPGRQPLSSNPLSDVMTLSNLDHLLKHVPEQSAPRCVKNPTPLPNHRPAAGWLLAARRQGQGHSSALRGDTHTCSHIHTLRDGSKKPPSHRNLRGRVGGRDRESERSGKRRNGREERERERARVEEERQGSTFKFKLLYPLSQESSPCSHRVCGLKNQTKKQ